MQMCPIGATCVDDCKSAFDKLYTPCLRGNIPLLLPKGFRDEQLNGVLSSCFPNDRKAPLELHFHVLVRPICLTLASFVRFHCCGQLTLMRLVM